MKELVRQFEKESGLEIYGLGAKRDKWEHTMEKFAELVVKECVRVVDDTLTENQEMNIGLVMASAAIVSHFGVEE